MKIYHSALFLSLVLILLVVSSCMQSSEISVTPASTTSFPVTNTEISAPIYTSLPTEIPTQISTPTVVPTLPVKQAELRFLGLLSNNDNCHLPCIWGITPGESTNQDANTILVPLSSLSYTVYLDTPRGGGISPRYREDKLEIYTNVSFLTDPDSHVVKRIIFNAEAHRPVDEGGYENVFDSKFFGEKIAAYTLPQVLSELGIPESVLMYTFGGPLTRGGKGGFDLVLLYPKQGIAIEYTTQMHLNDKNVYGCFTGAHVEIELQQPGMPAVMNVKYYKPLEEVTAMSVEEFYEIFRVSTDTCIETLAEVWPTQEP
jgi:hypothetical protein